MQDLMQCHYTSGLDTLSNLLPWQVGVKSVTYSGRVCIMTGPLLNQMPIVTFSKVSHN